jgi:hypothetical protein
LPQLPGEQAPDELALRLRRPGEQAVEQRASRRPRPAAGRGLDLTERAIEIADAENRVVSARSDP